MFEFAVFGGDARYLCEPVLLDDNGTAQKAELSGEDPIDSFANELREVVHCIRDGQTSEVLGAILAQDAMRLCERQAESLRLGAPVRV
jgi:hypothetical protein